MSQLTVSNSAQLNVSSNVFVEAIYLVSAPSVLVDAITPTKGSVAPFYANPFQCVFPDLVQGALYRVILYESEDGTASGDVRCSMDIDANGQTVTMRSDLHIYGGDAGATIGQPTYVDTSLVGWEYSLEEANAGTLDPVNRPQVTINNAGGWTLINGENIQQDQHFIHHFQPQISTAIPSAPSLINSGQILTDSITLDQTYVNQDLYLRGVNSNFIITLPTLSIIGDYQQLIFKSDGGIHKTVRILCAGSDMIFRRTSVTYIDLGIDEKLVLIKANGVWNVDNDLVNLDRVGEMFWSDQEDIKNTLSLNAQQVSTNDYPRITDFVNKNPDILVTQLLWDTNTDANGNLISQGKYAITGTVLQLPFAGNAGVLKAINGTTGRNAADFEDWAVLDHRHLESARERGSFGQSGNLPGGFYGGSNTGLLNLTSGILDATGNPISRVSTEPRVRNRAAFLLVRC